MTARTRKVERIHSVLRQMEKLQQRKVALIERRCAENQAEQEALIRALNEDHALHGLFIDTTARRLRSLAEAGARLVREREIEQRRLIAQAARARAAGNLAADVAEEARRAAEQADPREVIERVSVPSRRRASPP